MGTSSTRSQRTDSPTLWVILVGLLVLALAAFVVLSLLIIFVISLGTMVAALLRFLFRRRPRKHHPGL